MILKSVQIISLCMVWFFINITNAFCQHFNYHQSEDSYSILILTATVIDVPLESNDEIGIFAIDDSGNTFCAGAVVLSEGQPPVGLSAWVDDSQTPQKDGFVKGELMEFRIWDSSEQIEYFTSAEYDEGDGTWGYGIYSTVHLSTTIPVPVELSGFTARPVNNSVVLEWITYCDYKKLGFVIQRSEDNFSFIKVGFVRGKGTSNSACSYKFEDRGLLPGKYFYRLKQIDIDGSFTYSEVVSVIINNPITNELTQNCPNPFNSHTRIGFRLVNSGKVIINIFNLSGELVRILVNEHKGPGNFSVFWDGKDSYGKDVVSGVYSYQLHVNNFVQTRKMIVIR